MRKNRVVEQNRCYHLVSRLAHRDDVRSMSIGPFALRDAKEIAKLFVIQTSIDFLKYE